VLEGKLADPQLYAKDPTLFAKTADLLEKKRSEHSAMEEEWLELEMLREELEG
jgi:ATP-binding cassette subfamily F protein uup